MSGVCCRWVGSNGRLLGDTARAAGCLRGAELDKPSAAEGDGDNSVDELDKPSAGDNSVDEGDGAMESNSQASTAPCQQRACQHFDGFEVEAATTTSNGASARDEAQGAAERGGAAVSATGAAVNAVALG